MPFTLPTCNNTHHVTVVGPRAELHEALLLVEREKFHIDLAGGFVYGRRVPRDLSGKVQYGLGHDRDLVIAVGAERKKPEIGYCSRVSFCFPYEWLSIAYLRAPREAKLLIYCLFTNPCPPSSLFSTKRIIEIISLMFICPLLIGCI